MNRHPKGPDHPAGGRRGVPGIATAACGDEHELCAARRSPGAAVHSARPLADARGARAAPSERSMAATTVIQTVSGNRSGTPARRQRSDRDGRPTSRTAHRRIPARSRRRALPRSHSRRRARTERGARSGASRSCELLRRFDRRPVGEELRNCGLLVSKRARTSTNRRGGLRDVAGARRCSGEPACGPLVQPRPIRSEGPVPSDSAASTRPELTSGRGVDGPEQTALRNSRNERARNHRLRHLARMRETHELGRARRCPSCRARDCRGLRRSETPRRRRPLDGSINRRRASGGARIDLRSAVRSASWLLDGIPRSAGSASRSFGSKGGSHASHRTFIHLPRPCAFCSREPCTR